MNCLDKCDHLIPLSSLYERAGDFAFDLTRAVMCFTCTSAMRDYWPSRTERLALWRKLRDVIIPPLSEEEEKCMTQRTWKVPCAEFGKDGKPTVSTVYIHVTCDGEGNPYNVIIDVGNAGRGLNAAKAGLGISVHHLFEWGCPVEEVSHIFIGHASNAGPARWAVENQLVFSLEDLVGKVLRLVMAGRTIGEFLRQYGG